MELESQMEKKEQKLVQTTGKTCLDLNNRGLTASDVSEMGPYAAGLA